MTALNGPLYAQSICLQNWFDLEKANNANRGHDTVCLC
jgi:hypothetical protein